LDYRPIAETDLCVSPLILGGWQFGDKGWGYTEEKELLATIEEAIDAGINLIDTAWVYGQGRSEEIIGQVLRYKRDRVYIATKCLPRIDQLRVQLEDSLRRLQVSCIDLYQVHWLSSPEQIKPILEQLSRFQEEGKIRYIGVSNFSLADHEEALRYASIVSSQPPYSMLKRDIERDILPFCLQRGIAVLVYSPLQKGLLTGKYRGGETFPQGDVRSWDRYFSKGQFQRNIDLVNRLRPLAQKYNKTLTQLVLNWTYHRPGITAAIMGVKNREQLRENLGALGWELDPADLRQIDTLFPPAKT